MGLSHPYFPLFFRASKYASAFLAISLLVSKSSGKYLAINFSQS